MRGSGSWLVAVGDVAGAHQALLVVEARRAAMYTQLAEAVRAVGFTAMELEPFQQGRWPVSPSAYVEVRDGRVIRFSTGHSSLLPGRRTMVPEAWLEAATRTGRVLLGVAPPGTIPPGGVGAGTVLNPGGMLCASAQVRFLSWEGAR